MKMCKEKAEERKTLEGMKEYLDKVLNGEDVLGQMLDDILYLSVLVDLQNDFLRLIELHYYVVPEGFADFVESIKRQADRTVEKWENYILSEG